jgi:hypothetical protein
VRVAVLGAYGGVGRAATRRLHELGIGPLRLGGRDLGAAESLLQELGGDGDAVTVDVHDQRQLADFCSGAGLVLNCAGPSSQFDDRVAVATLAAGADYVDAGGDERLHALLDRRLPAGATALLSAGVMPGLSALLVRALADRVDRPTELVAHAGGLGRFTFAAAADYLAGLDTAGTALAAWHDGIAVPGALAVRHETSVDGFPGRVHAHLFLPHELERVAATLGLRAAEWWTVFDGDRVQGALARRAGVAELIAAADLDAFGRTPYQRFVLRLRGASGAATLTFRAREPIELTGDMAAITAVAVLGGEAPGGLGYAGEVLPPEATLRALRSCDSVESMAVSTALSEAEDDQLVVEGVL